MHDFLAYKEHDRYLESLAVDQINRNRTKSAAAMPYPETLKENPKIIFFTDFDGTITLNDSNDWLVMRATAYIFSILTGQLDRQSWIWGEASKTRQCRHLEQQGDLPVCAQNLEKFMEPLEYINQLPTFSLDLA